jgi:hypothetical protein
MQAYRDNHRIALVDAPFVERLWEKCGLKLVAEGLTFHGRRAAGLNPNLRIYRYASATCNTLKCIFQRDCIRSTYTHRELPE